MSFLKRKKSGRRICCYGVRHFPSLFLLLLLKLLLLLFFLHSVQYLDKRQEKLRTEAAEASTGTGSAGPTQHPTEKMNVDSNSNIARRNCSYKLVYLLGMHLYPPSARTTTGQKETRVRTQLTNWRPT